MTRGRRATRFGVGLLTALLAAVPVEAQLPEGFVDLAAAVPGLQVELRYAGADNFVGRPIDGYQAARALGTPALAEALASAQRELRPFGLRLRVYDAYRPARAVADFMRWAADPNDRVMKDRFYPGVAKRRLVAEGYIAARSSHSRGSTVDLSLVALGPAEGAQPLDMGTPWDFFGPESRPDSDRVSPQARANRLLLRQLMIRHGFAPYAQEWWHFTLRNEPHPERIFDFPIR